MSFSSGRYFSSMENLSKSAKFPISFHENNCLCDIIATGESFLCNLFGDNILQDNKGFAYFFMGSILHF